MSRPSHSVTSWVLRGPLPGLALVVCACVSNEETTRDITLDEPRISRGVLLEKPADWADRWERLTKGGQTDPEAQYSVLRDADVPEPPQAVVANEAPPSSGDSWPPGSGRIVDLPRLKERELREFLLALTRRLQTEHGYELAASAAERQFPALPGQLRQQKTLVRRTPIALHCLRLGVWEYQAQLPQLVLYGAALTDGELSAEADLGVVDTAIKAVLFSRNEMRRALPPDSLESRVVQLNYIDVPSAMSAMKGLGLSTFEVGTDLPAEVEFPTLPLVVELPGPKDDSKGLVGGSSQIQTTEIGSSTIPALASPLSGNTIASPASRILVLYHPNYPEQFSRVRQLLDDIIDRPARQIFVEGLVLEIDEGGLDELGIEWEFEDSKIDMMLGALVPDIRNPPETLNVDSEKDLELRTDWKLKIRALVADGKAEILSRPSILTLNERQATIRVGVDIPIATSQEGLSDSASKIAFDFKYIPTGILLNIRPRATEDGNEVSLMVDTVVSSTVPEGDLEIRDNEGTLLASAPRVQSRRVQTYARIQNNTPFIIGGLVSRSKTDIESKVPVLGDIPLLGYLFRSQARRDSRQEVIIVLTPYVLPEELHLSRALPKSGVDSPPSELSRGAYRLGPEDLVDISFLYTNLRFQTYIELARKAIREDFRLAERGPFQPFAKGHLPGTKVLVDRIVYSAIQRLELEGAINPERIVVVTGLQASGYEVALLDTILARQGEGEEYEDFFTNYPDKALALTFVDPYETPGGEKLASDPVPQIRLFDCPDRATWSRLLWDLNQPHQSGRKRFTILLHRPVDVVRLQRTFLLKGILEINGGRAEANFRNFIPGRMVEVPHVAEGSVHLLSAEIARNFYHSVHYYPETIVKIEAALLELDKALRMPEWTHLLEETPLPELKTHDDR